MTIDSKFFNQFSGSGVLNLRRKQFSRYANTVLNIVGRLAKRNIFTSISDWRAASEDLCEMLGQEMKHSRFASIVWPNKHVDLL